MAWSWVGVSASVESTGATITLAEPAGVAAGDLLVACFASRSTATTAITATGWTAVNSQNNNNTLTTGSAIGSGTMLYAVRGASAPTYIFTIPTGISVCLGRVVAYRGGAATTPLDASTAVTAGAGTSVSVAGLTTTQANDLIVAMTAGGQEAAWSAFNNVTTPIGSSGTGSSITAAPSASQWQERADVQTTGGADTSLAIFDAIRTAAGATGNLTATASVSAGHVVIAGAFKILPTPTADAWNINDKSAVVTLSNSDKTATSTGASAGARSTTVALNGAAGKYYAEYVIDIMGATTQRVGITPTSNSLTGSTANFYTQRTGTIIVNSITVGDFGSAWIANDVICVAWNAGTERVWFRRNGGLWNNDASADPAAETNGLDVSFAASTNHALWGYANNINSTITIRTELAEYTQAVPSGFTSWMGETPVGGTNVTANAAGQLATTAVEPVTVATTQNVAPFVSNQLATTSVGTVDVKIGNTGIAESQVAATAVGDVLVAGGANASPFSFPATAGVGTVDVTTTLGALTTVTGQEATASVGTATVGTVSSDSVIAASQVAITAVGDVIGKVAIRADAASQLATVSAGTASVTTTTGVATTVTGQQIVVAQGNVSIAAGGAITAGATSQLATLTVGDVTVDVTAVAAGMNVWNGSAWVDRPAKVWTGAVWAQKPVKVWNGSAWL